MDENERPSRMDIQRGDSVTRQLSDGVAIQQPLVIDLKLEKLYRRRLREAAFDERKSVVVTVSGVAPRRDANLSIRLFLNLPTADLKTPPDDPHYAGSFSFFLDVSEKNAEFSQSIELDQVIRNLSKKGLWNDTNALVLTLLATPLNEREVSADARAKVASISLGIAESSK